MKYSCKEKNCTNHEWLKFPDSEYYRHGMDIRDQPVRRFAWREQQNTELEILNKIWSFSNQKFKQMKKKEAIRNAKNFDEILDIQYGIIGTKKRDEFEEKAQYFVISETLKDARQKAHLTQEQLAEKIGTKKSYISRLENGKCDIQLSTLFRIFEDGLGKRISLLIG